MLKQQRVLISRTQSNFCHLGNSTHCVYEGSDYYIQFYLFSAYQVKQFLWTTIQFLGENKNVFLWCKRSSAEHTDVPWDPWKQRVILLQ